MNGGYDTPSKPLHETENMDWVKVAYTDLATGVVFASTLQFQISCLGRVKKRKIFTPFENLEIDDIQEIPKEIK